MPSFASDKGSHGDSKLPVGKSKDENISELGRIFNTALEKYLKSTKRELQDLTHVDDFHDAIVGTEQMASHFDKTRHPETKLNAVLTTVEPCMDWVSYGFQFVADHASGSVCPLRPQYTLRVPNFTTTVCFTSKSHCRSCSVCYKGLG